MLISRFKNQIVPLIGAKEYFIAYHNAKEVTETPLNFRDDMILVFETPNYDYVHYITSDDELNDVISTLGDYRITYTALIVKGIKAMLT